MMRLCTLERSQDCAPGFGRVRTGLRLALKASVVCVVAANAGCSSDSYSGSEATTGGTTAYLSTGGTTAYLSTGGTAAYLSTGGSMVMATGGIHSTGGSAIGLLPNTGGAKTGGTISGGLGTGGSGIGAIGGFSLGSGGSLGFGGFSLGSGGSSGFGSGFGGFDFGNFGGFNFGFGGGGLGTGGVGLGTGGMSIGPSTGGVPTGGTVGSTTPSNGLAPTSLPTATATCPTIKSGSVTFLGVPVTIWAGTPTASQSGPVVIYWYATGSSPQEALQGLGQAAINEIVAQGGLVAAPASSNKKGTNTGDFVWYTGDFETTDEVIACAIQQMHIDTKRIYASGFSAGGLQTTVMSYARSNYMASVAPYSGGSSGMGNGTVPDPSNIPAAMVIHGAPGSDTFIMDFAKASATYEADIKSRGGFAIDCNHGGGHQIPSGIASSVWQFMKDHPYKVSPEPYAGGIPAGFPSYCKLP